MTFAIHTLNTHWRSAVPLPPQRLQGWVDALAAQDGDTLASSLVPQDEWLFIRQLPLWLRFRADAADADVGVAWRQSLTQALQQALAAPAGHDVVHYVHRHDAWADLLYRSALGETQRQWVWQRMGLLPRAGLGAAHALELGTLALLREAPAVWPVLARLVAGEAACASLTALVRGWSAGTWREVLLASPRTRVYGLASVAITAADAPDDGPVAPPQDLPAAARELLAWARARAPLVAARPQALHVLLAATAWPGWPASATQAAQRLRAVHSMARPPSAAAGAEDTTRPTAAVADATTPRSAGAARATLPREREASAPALPPLPTLAAADMPTAWGGLLFWLGQLPRLGIVTADNSTPPPLLMLALARALGAPDDDPVVAAFCGGSMPAGEMPAAFENCAQGHAQDLEQWLAEAAPDLAPPRLVAVGQRAGHLHITPGWIELRLPLAGVDTAVRRLGLDLDPGWLPWLGCVVHIRYED